MLSKILKYKKMIIDIVIGIVFIGALAVIILHWNEMWHTFGANLYSIFH